MIQKFKHYATGEIIEVDISDGVGFAFGKCFDVIEDKKRRIKLKGTSYFKII